MILVRDITLLIYMLLGLVKIISVGGKRRTVLLHGMIIRKKIKRTLVELHYGMVVHVMLSRELIVGLIP
jgi:hypothetical protein